jgi:hypothetical protein
LHTAFGIVLFAAWGMATILWVYTALYALGESDPGPAIRALCALPLMLLLAGMEGLEVAVIDRWRTVLAPERSELAGWLSARQLIVTLLVIIVTLLAEPEFIAIPGLSTVITGGVVLKAFTVTWTTFTVLWFMQIFPKHMAATNPDRYLRHTRRWLFPFVNVGRHIGISLPGEWVASTIEHRRDWHTGPSIEEASTWRQGDRIEVEVIQPDGRRALIAGKLNAVPESPGGRRLHVKVCDAHITPPPAEGVVVWSE